METKKIELEIPVGKVAKWVNNVLTLIDEKPQDDTERIKTFEDACAELGENHPFVKSYLGYFENVYESDGNDNDVLAYLQLRIICAALNEGWEPDWQNDEEYKYYPWFGLYTEEAKHLDDDDKERCCCINGRSGDNASAYGGLAYMFAYGASLFSHANYGYRLAFKTMELAEYCGKQFAGIWAYFLLNIKK